MEIYYTTKVEGKTGAVAAWSKASAQRLRIVAQLLGPGTRAGLRTQCSQAALPFTGLELCISLQPACATSGQPGGTLWLHLDARCVMSAGAWLPSMPCRGPGAQLSWHLHRGGRVTLGGAQPLAHSLQHQNRRVAHSQLAVLCASGRPCRRIC